MQKRKRVETIKINQEGYLCKCVRKHLNKIEELSGGVFYCPICKNFYSPRQITIAVINCKKELNK